MNDYGTLDEALAKWDAGSPVWTIEMGGLGPGYEQAIQVGIFELARRLRGVVIPEEPNRAFNDALDERLHATIKEVSPVLDGLSGAQAGAIKGVAWRYATKGYNERLHEVEAERRIQCSKKFPAFA